MEEKSKHKISAYIFTSIIVVVCGWSAFWVGVNGIKVALTKSGHISFKSAAVTGKVPAIVSPSPASSDTASIFDAMLPKRSSEISIMIAGDVMLDRGVRSLGRKYGYESLFEAVAPLFKKADITAVNLEGPITGNASKTLLPDGKTSKELTFTFATTTAKALEDAGISIVSLANNHTDNFGSSGLKETKDWLDRAGIKWFGSPWNSSSTESVIVKNGVTVAFVGYHAFEPGFDRVLKTVKSLSEKEDFVIVMPHWGAEYATSSSEKMRAQARSLADAGAKAIFGSHPHVILDREWLGDVPVFYSLGNLLFDQFFSPEVMQGNIVELDLKKDQDGTRINGIKVYETSTASRKGISLETKADEFVKP
jgi:poly-gamma-glutamate synthesis protein (capsule biosynthesis protein)